MQPTMGDVFEGKITGITKFGAFVSLEDGKNGLVHISEIANSFVSDVHDHVSEGQTVKVKVIGINETGKINLSIKQAAEPTAGGEPPRRAPPHQPPTPRPFQRPQPSAPPAEATFEDKLKQFMQDADNRISDSRMYSDKKSGYRRRRD